MRAVCRVARPETEATLLEMARYATTSQLEEIVRTYRKVTGSEELRDANDRHDARASRWYWDDDGSLVVQARLSPEDGAVFLSALEAGRTAAEPAGGRKSPAGTGLNDSAESRLPEAKSADALVAMAKLALAAPQDAAPPLPEVVIVDRRTLSGASDEGRCHLDGGVALPPETARRLACDATVVAMVEAADGTPLDVGRKRRTPTARLRRALRRRDGCCRFPGCGRRRFLHAHHVLHWINGGETKLGNLILLCSFHHRLVHEGGYRVEVLGEHVFQFFDRAGRIVPESPSAPPLGGPSLVARNAAAGVAITPDTGRSLGAGEPYDLGLTIDALVAVRVAGSLDEQGHAA